MTYISLDYKGKSKTPKYKIRILVTKEDIYIYPEAIFLNEMIATMDYYDSTIVHKNHVYVGLIAIMRDKFAGNKVVAAAKEIFNAISSSDEYSDAVDQLFNLE